MYARHGGQIAYNRSLTYIAETEQSCPGLEAHFFVQDLLLPLLLKFAPRWSKNCLSFTLIELIEAIKPENRIGFKKFPNKLLEGSRAQKSVLNVVQF